MEYLISLTPIAGATSLPFLCNPGPMTAYNGFEFILKKGVIKIQYLTSFRAHNWGPDPVVH